MARHFAADRNFAVTITNKDKNANFMAPNVVAKLRKDNPDYAIKFAVTTETINVTTNKTVAALIEISPELVTRFHGDKDGVVTLAHEKYHARDFQNQKAHKQVKAADIPAPGEEYGAAELFGLAVREEAPDISEAEATRLINEIVIFQN